MEVDFERIVLTTRRLWKTAALAVLMLAILLASFGVVNRHYTATTQLLVSSKLSGYALVAEGNVTSTLESLATSDTVLNRVIRSLELDLTSEQLRRKVNVSVVPGTQIIEIAVGDRNPQRAAEISNAISSSLVASATDLAIGETQRHMDELVYEVNQSRDRIITIDAQIGILDTEANQSDSGVQARINQLRTERLQLSQLAADIDSQIRSLNTTLTTSTVPLVIVDSAAVPAKADSVSPILLGLLGVFLGMLMVAIAIIVISAVDRKIRSEGQIDAGPVLATLRSSEIGAQNSDPGRLGFVTSVLSLAASQANVSRVAVVCPRGGDEASSLTHSLASMADGSLVEIIAVDGLLERGEAVGIAGSTQAAVVVIQRDRTEESDMIRTVEVLDLIGASLLGSIYIDR